jgi:hypothetical protein
MREDTSAFALIRIVPGSRLGHHQAASPSMTALGQIQTWRAGERMSGLTREADPSQPSPSVS